MKVTKSTPLEAVAALVCEALQQHKIEAILVGGAVVSIYTLNEYQSYDLDFILPGLEKDVDKAMQSLGFTKGKSRHWIHAENPFFVEFPGSVVAIGNSTDVEIQKLKTAAGVIKLLSPTSSVMDRLAAYYHWNDRQCLNQAVMIALKHPINMKRIENWSKREGEPNKFQNFLATLKQAEKEK